MPIFVGLLVLDLYIPEANSLKEKRHVVRSLLKRLQNRFNVAVAEVGDNDVHRRAQIGVTAVSSSQAQVQRVLQAASGFVSSEPRVVVEADSLEVL